MILPVVLALCCFPARARTAATHAAAAHRHASAPHHGSRGTRHSPLAPRRFVTFEPRAFALAFACRTSQGCGAAADDPVEDLLPDATDDLTLKSSAALVVDRDTGEALVLKNPDVVLPIASLTKLMTALVVLDARLPMDEELEIDSSDTDITRHTSSRLTVGTRLRRDEMLLLALMSSENRAALCLSRNYPGGRAAFIEQMNAKAKTLGMTSTHYADPAGLSNQSVSTARDLNRLLSAADAQAVIREDSTQPEGTVVANGRTLTFVNTNRLVRDSGDWDIGLQKTGFTNEAGRCLVMHVSLMSRRLAMIFLDSNGTLTRYADAARVRKYLDTRNLLPHLPVSPVAVAGSLKG